jgi:hypothetical protein
MSARCEGLWDSSIHQTEFQRPGGALVPTGRQMQVAESCLTGDIMIAGTVCIPLLLYYYFLRTAIRLKVLWPAVPISSTSRPISALLLSSV